MRLLRSTIGIFLLVLAAFAQSDRGTITGTVLDPAGAVVPAAKVTARHLETGTVSETTTTGTGNYTLPSLPAGLYEVSVEAAGFKKATQQRVQVQVAQTARVDLTLEVGALTESVVVTASVPLLRTENAEQSMNVSGDRINSLPLNFGGGGGATGSIRNWLSFIILAPGVSGTTERAPVNGAPAGAFKIYVEGQDVTSSNDTVWTSTVAAASVETIGEFSMQTANFAAEFGQVLGGVLNFTTKSGANQFHGSGYEYFTNEALDARRHFTGAKPISRKHDFGFTVGGPVTIPKLYNGRDKTFFFFNLELFRNKTRSAGTWISVPTAAYRNGDFSAALTGRQLGTDPAGRAIMENTVYDPRSDRTVNASLVRDPYPGNLVPKSFMDPVALKIQALIPNPDNPEVINNWQPDTENHRYQSIPSIKIDHSFSDAMKLSGYWSVQKTDQITSPDGLPVPITSRRDQKIYGHTVRLNLDRTITPRLLVHLGAGYLRFHNPDSSPPGVLRYDAVKELGFAGSATDPAGFPYITGLSSNRGGFSQYSMGPGTAGLYYNDKLTSVLNATYIRNNHTYKLGGEFKQEVWADNNFYGAQGQLNFSAAQTALPYLQTTSVGGGSIGFGYASFLLGLVNTANVNAVKTLQWRKQAWSLYVQDSWKITRRLTLDYGLRWDYAGQGHELHWRTSEVGINTPNPSAGGLPGGFVYEGYGPGRCNCTFVQAYPYAIGPRLGMAYQIDPKTVFRAGWGVTYSALANWWYVTGGSSTLGFFNSVTWTTAFGQPAVRAQEGLHYNVADLYTASLNPGIRPSPGQLDVPPAWGAQMNDPNGGRPGRVNQWNIAVQREIARNLSLEAAYVGNRGVWLEANALVAMNATNPATLQARGLSLTNAADRQLLTSTIGSALAASRGFKAPYAGYPSWATVAQTLRPFPQFNDGLTVRWAPLGSSWYDSLQVKFTKRYSHGLDMTAAFTWQKELARGTGGNPGAGGGGINDVFNRQNQKSLTGSSQPLILVMGVNYETPRVGPNRLVRQALGGWTFGGILRYSSGSLIGVPGSRNNLAQLNYQNTRFNRVPGEPLFLKDPNCHCIDPNKELVLNPKAWSDAAAGEWGFSAPYYNDYRWQRSATEQASLGRSFRIRERMFFQVRAEFFNLFNRTFLPGPSSGNPLQTPTYSSQSVPTGGFGYINATSTSGQRNGQLVARFQW